MNIAGKKFGRWRVLEPRKIGKSATWLCRCECGLEKVVYQQNLITGKSKSCGCLFREIMAEVNKRQGTHRKTHTRLYRIWSGMKSRCYNNKTCLNFKLYGGKGITVCEEWLDNFIAFYNWSMANGYEEHLTIDRINGNKGYEPDNCRWATHKEQQQNLSTNRKLTIFGETKNITQWVSDNRCTVSRNLLSFRLRKGWNPEVALTQKPKSRRIT